jgi:hypothetical protein
MQHKVYHRSLVKVWSPKLQPDDHLMHLKLEAVFGPCKLLVYAGSNSEAARRDGAQHPLVAI